MFTRLVFTIDGQEIVFHSHEVVKIACEMMNEMQDEAIPIPDYQSYEAYLSDNIDAFLEDVIPQYEQHYGIDHAFTAVDEDNEPVNNPLLCLLQKLYKTDMSLFLMTGLFTGPYSRLLNFIKEKEKPSDPISSDQSYHGLMLPPAIQGIDTLKKWLFMARYAQGNSDVDQVSGWWLIVGGRVILLRNYLNEDQHLYVSDHGLSDAIIKNIEHILPQFDEQGSKLSLYQLLFWRKFYQHLSQHEKGYLKDRFAMLLAQGYGGDHDRNTFILFVLGLPQSCQAIALQNGRLDTPGFNVGNSIGTKNRAEDPWVLPVPEKDLASISVSYRTHIDAIFDMLIEQIRYSAEILTRSYITSLFKQGLSPFYTQLDQIFHPDDARHFKIVYTLSQVARSLGKGLQEFLYRPMASFGSRDEGESYRGFADAFEAYLILPDAHPEDQLAAIMRSILYGQNIDDENLYFIPNLVAAWFVSEAARNELSLLTGLMLIDMIENGIKLYDSDLQNLYQWKHTLVHPSKRPKGEDDNQMMRDLYGTEVRLNEFDGTHPACHYLSRGDHLNTRLANGTRLSPVRQKEGSLLLHWIYIFLQARHIDLDFDDAISVSAMQIVRVEDSSLVTNPDYNSIDPNPSDKNTQKKKPTIASIIKRIKALKRKKSLSEKDRRTLTKKYKLLLRYTVIEPCIQARLSRLGNLLSHVAIQSNPTSHTRESFPSIHRLAAHAGNLARLKVLLEDFHESCEHHVNSQDDSGNTPINYAVRGKNEEAVKLLRRHGAIFDTKTLALIKGSPYYHERFGKYLTPGTQQMIFSSAHQKYIFPPPQITRRNVTALGLRIVEQPVDGNCLFHTAAETLENCTHVQLRKRTVAFMRDNVVLFRPFTNGRDEEFLQRTETMAKDREWADMFEVFALAHHLDRPMVVIHRDINRNHLIFNPEGQNEPIFLYYTFQLHYGSLLPQEGQDPWEIFQRLVTEADEFRQNPQIVYHDEAACVKDVRITPAGKSRNVNEENNILQHVIFEIIMADAMQLNIMENRAADLQRKNEQGALNEAGQEELAVLRRQIGNTDRDNQPVTSESGLVAGMFGSSTQTATETDDCVNSEGRKYDANSKL